jgi:hypothetical protein
VIHSFFTVFITQDAVVGWEKHMLSSQQVSGADLSCTRSQKNTLCFGWQEDLQIQLEIGTAALLPLK